MIKTDYTEADTYEKLRRVSFEEMSRLHRAWWSSLPPPKNSSLRIPFTKQYGWSWFDFVLEAKRRADYTSFYP